MVKSGKWAQVGRVAWAAAVWHAYPVFGQAVSAPIAPMVAPTTETSTVQAANVPVLIPVVNFEQQPGAPVDPLVDRTAAESRRAATQPTELPVAMNATMPDWTRVGGAVVAVVGLVMLFRAGAGRWWGVSARGARSQALRVVGRSVMGHKQQLILIQVGRRLVLAADSNGQVSRLAEITDPEEVSRLLGEVPMGGQPAFGQALLDAEAGIGLLDSQIDAAQGRRLRSLDSDDFSELANLSGRLAEIRRGWTADDHEPRSIGVGLRPAVEVSL